MHTAVCVSTSRGITDISKQIMAKHENEEDYSTNENQKEKNKVNIEDIEWLDVFEILKTCAKDMQKGEMIYDKKEFKLELAMHSVELMQGKMDLGFLPSKSLTARIAKDLNILRKNLNYSEITILFDYLFICLHMWLDGQHPLRNIFTCVYFHDLEFIENMPILYDFFVCYLKICVFTKNILSGTPICFEEDFCVGNECVIFFDLLNVRDSSVIRDMINKRINTLINEYENYESSDNVVCNKINNNNNCTIYEEEITKGKKNAKYFEKETQNEIKKKQKSKRSIKISKKNNIEEENEREWILQLTYRFYFLLNLYDFLLLLTDLKQIKVNRNFYPQLLPSSSLSSFLYSSSFTKSFPIINMKNNYEEIQKINIFLSNMDFYLKKIKETQYLCNSKFIEEISKCFDETLTKHLQTAPRTSLVSLPNISFFFKLWKNEINQLRFIVTNVVQANLSFKHLISFLKKIRMGLPSNFSSFSVFCRTVSYNLLSYLFNFPVQSFSHSASLLSTVNNIKYNQLTIIVIEMLEKCFISKNLFYEILNSQDVEVPIIEIEKGKRFLKINQFAFNNTKIDETSIIEEDLVHNFEDKCNILNKKEAQYAKNENEEEYGENKKKIRKKEKIAQNKINSDNFFKNEKNRNTQKREKKEKEDYGDIEKLTIEIGKFKINAIDFILRFQENLAYLIQISHYNTSRIYRSLDTMWKNFKDLLDAANLLQTNFFNFFKRNFSIKDKVIEFILNLVLEKINLGYKIELFDTYEIALIEWMKKLIYNKLCFHTQILQKKKKNVFNIAKIKIGPKYLPVKHRRLSKKNFSLKTYYAAHYYLSFSIFTFIVFCLKNSFTDVPYNLVAALYESFHFKMSIFLREFPDLINFDFNEFQTYFLEDQNKADIDICVKNLKKTELLCKKFAKNKLNSPDIFISYIYILCIIVYL